MIVVGSSSEEGFGHAGALHCLVSSMIQCLCDHLLLCSASLIGFMVWYQGKDVAQQGRKKEKQRGEIVTISAAQLHGVGHGAQDGVSQENL